MKKRRPAASLRRGPFCCSSGKTGGDAGVSLAEPLHGSPWIQLIRKPGISFTITGHFLSAATHSRICRTFLSDVFSPATISHSGSKWGGFSQCCPIKRSGRRTRSAMAETGRLGVFVDSSAVSKSKDAFSTLTVHCRYPRRLSPAKKERQALPVSPFWSVLF